MEISASTGLPLCQDTGMVEFFVELGHQVRLEDSLQSILDCAVRRAYMGSPFRYSIVCDPLYRRENTQDNTPSIIHLVHARSSTLRIAFLIKGGGSENTSALKMFAPTVSEEALETHIFSHLVDQIPRACPPVAIGVGIGGSAEQAMVLSKMALLHDHCQSESVQDPWYQLRKRIFDRIQNWGIGVQALGQGLTSFDLRILHRPCHIATLPVGISMDCYLQRKGVVVLDEDE